MLAARAVLGSVGPEGAIPAAAGADEFSTPAEGRGLPAVPANRVEGTPDAVGPSAPAPRLVRSDSTSRERP